MHLRCAGPNTVKILSVGMDKVPRGPVLSANVVCFSMEVASQSLKAYIGCVVHLQSCIVMFTYRDFSWVPCVVSSPGLWSYCSVASQSGEDKGRKKEGKCKWQFLTA